MANLSTAQGYITITAETESEIHAVIELLETAHTLYYNTTVYSEDYVVQRHPHPVAYSVTLPFVGSGRWTYERNARKIFQDIATHPDGLESLPGPTRSLLDASDFRMVMEWSEYELGFNFVAGGVIRYRKDPGTSVIDLIPAEIAESEAPLTLENLKIYGFDTAEWVDFSIEGIDNFINHFSNQPDFLGSLKDRTAHEIFATLDKNTTIEQNRAVPLSYLNTQSDIAMNFRDKLLGH